METRNGVRGHVGESRFEGRGRFLLLLPWRLLKAVVIVVCVVPAAPALLAGMFEDWDGDTALMMLCAAVVTLTVPLWLPCLALYFLWDAVR